MDLAVLIKFYIVIDPRTNHPKVFLLLNIQQINVLRNKNKLKVWKSLDT